jgi:hypothetical protein
MIRNYLLILFFLIASKQVFCQQISIGTINLNDKMEMNDKCKRAMKVAYMRTFADGRKLDTFFINKIGQVKYLILLGSKGNVNSKSAVSILIINNTVNINANSEMKTCSNGACNECSFFTENNKVVACKCESNGSISNHCTYKINDGNYFYTLVKKIMEE